VAKAEPRRARRHAAETQRAAGVRERAVSAGEGGDAALSGGESGEALGSSGGDPSSDTGGRSTESSGGAASDPGASTGGTDVPLECAPCICGSVNGGTCSLAVRAYNDEGCTIETSRSRRHLQRPALEPPFVSRASSPTAETEAKRLWSKASMKRCRAKAAAYAIAAEID
jgi:hypothetical protein